MTQILLKIKQIKPITTIFLFYIVNYKITILQPGFKSRNSLSAKRSGQ